MVRFSIFGIPVCVQPFFWISLLIIGGALDADSPDAVMKIALFVIAGFISILIHELGHALTARRFGAFSEITLHAFGGFAAYSGVRMTRLQNFLVTAAGPALQIVLGLAVRFALAQGLPFIQPNGIYFLVVLAWISIAWALLNLLPVVPLDGGRMLDAILGPQRIKITLWVTIIVAVGVGILMLTQRGSFIFPIFMGMFAWQAFQALKDHHWR